MLTTKDIGPKTRCPKCESQLLGILDCSKEELARALEKKGKSLARSQRMLLEHAEETARLYKQYGIATAHVLAGRRIRTSDAKDILRTQNKISDRLYELIMEAERSSMRRRFV
jgi:hypothetical protein